MKFGLFTCIIVIAVLEKATTTLSPAGENVCLVDERYVDVIQVRHLVPVTTYKIEWCWNIPPRCTVETETFKPTIVNKHIPRVRIVPKCCQGYKEVLEEGKCVPHCSESCLHGNCTHPETCSCTFGYRGNRCDRPCEPGTWGQGCVEKCNCSGNGECEGVKGTCTCSPGWTGDRCEFPCEPGRYGANCEGICNCLGELCNHVSGECEAITETRVETGENATTTEGTIFVTTTEEITTVTDVSDAVTGYATQEVTEPSPTVDEITEIVESVEKVTILEFEENGRVVESEEEVTIVALGKNEESDVENATYPIEMILNVENATLVVDDVVSRVPDEVRIYVQPEIPDKKHPIWMNETDAENEIDDTLNFSADVQEKGLSIINLFENLSIVSGVFVIIFVLTMCTVFITHRRKAKTVGLDCRRDSNMNSHDFVIHKFYGGCNTPAKLTLDNQVTSANLDFDLELPKLMTFKPAQDEKADKEYFMRTNESQEDNFNVSKENTLNRGTLSDDYNNRLAQFDYDVPKSTTFVPAMFRYG